MASTENLSTTMSLFDKIASYSDPRVDDYLLMQSPIPIIVICVIYIYAVLKAGPEWMKNREPFTLRWLLIIYNAGQTIFSAWLFYHGIIYWIKYYGFRCINMDRTDRSEKEMWGITMCHMYFLSKISELADTVFFVLKKKQQHVSVLHVFHHAVMPFSTWFGMKFHPGGNLAFFGLPNLFVHIWMYLYYMLAAMGPQFQKYVWWKRHVTEMQLAQFALVMLYMLYVSYSCSLSKVFIFWIIVLDIVFVYLFTDFYIKAYKVKAKKAADAKAALLKETKKAE